MRCCCSSGPARHVITSYSIHYTKLYEVAETPDTYLFQNPEIPDCFSVRFRGQNFLALNGEVVGTLTERQGAIDFVMGHEIGRINDHHARWIPFIFPAMVLPLLGPAYARAKVYSYDRYGIAACKAKVDAAFALAVVASGSRRWKSFNRITSYNVCYTKLLRCRRAMASRLPGIGRHSCSDLM